MTVASEIAQQVIALRYADLPDEVVHHTKRVLLDTLACTLCGIGCDAGNIMEAFVREAGGTPEATVIGSGLRTSAINASLVNGVNARFADYMDNILVFYAPEKHIMGGHASLFIPGVLAMAERQHSSGKAVLEAINVGHQISGSFYHGDLVHAARYTNTLAKRGFDSGGTTARLIMPFVAGKLLGLNSEQMENAVGISVPFGVGLGITDAPGRGEVHTMAKNLRYPMGIQGGIMGALLAQRGFTGPATAIEGPEGLIEVTQDGKHNLDKLTAPWDQWYIKTTYLKYFWSQGGLQGPAWATLNAVTEHDIKPEEVQKVTVKQFTAMSEKFANPEMRHLPNKESADHSMYYICARVILDRALRAEQYTAEKLADPRLHELIDKIGGEGDPTLGRNETVVEIVTKRGTFSSHVKYPKGHPFNPLTDDEIEIKFQEPASRFMSDRQIKKVISTVNDLEKVADIGELVEQLVFPKSLLH